MDSEVPAFTAPGPGQWALDRSHFFGGTTPIVASLMEASMEVGMRRVFAELGTPADAVQARFVHGFMYTRLRPLVAPDRAATRLPPIPLLRIVAHLHPAFRRRARTARRVLAERPWLDVADRWERELKPALVAENRRFQAIHPETLDDATLAAHIAELIGHCRRQLDLHFWLHGYDLGPLANYVHSCIEWGITPQAALTALAGASPSTSAPARRLARLRAIVDASGVPPGTLDEIRAVSPEAAALLDEHLDERGHHLVTRYDIDGLTLGELPGTVVTSVLEASPVIEPDHEAIAAALRERVPPGDRAVFDDLLADARRVMDVRDDNGPNTYEWPAGLLRRAMLAAGHRLARRGAIDDAEHVFDLTPAELDELFTGPLPAAAELRRRASARAAAARLVPPPTLGDAEPTPPPDVLPDPLPRMIAMVQTALAQLGMVGDVTVDALVGAGVGTTPYTGRVRRAATPEEAIDTMEPGDVLVVRATSPAFNAVLSIAGAVVTADGGAMSHAAVLARELGIAAVVGARGALDLVDGSTVEVDPIAGRVRVLTG
jgi:pyruvate,water dikinase